MSCQGYLATFQTTVSLGKNQYSKETRLKNLLVSKNAENDDLLHFRLKKTTKLRQNKKDNLILHKFPKRVSNKELLS